MNKHSENPLITFGVTTYKRPELLQETIKSILSQDYKNFRIIIGNDNPLETITFKTLNIKQDSRVDILNYKKNIGEIRSMNYLLSKAKSEWFSWLADDDVLHPQFISKFIEINNSMKENNITAILCDYIEGQDTLHYVENALISNKSKSYDFESFVTDFFKRRIKIIGVYGFLKTKIIKEIRGLKDFGYGPPLYGDTGLTIELAERGKIILNESQLFFLRRHDSSLSTTIENIDEVQSSQKAFLTTYKPIFQRKLSNKKKYDKFIFLTLQWFCNDNLGVALRKKDQSKISSVLQFIYLEKKWIFEIKPTYVLLLFLYILLQLNLVIFNYFKLRLINNKKC